MSIDIRDRLAALDESMTVVLFAARTLALGRVKRFHREGFGLPRPALGLCRECDYVQYEDEFLSHAAGCAVGRVLNALKDVLDERSSADRDELTALVDGAASALPCVAARSPIICVCGHSRYRHTLNQGGCFADKCLCCAFSIGGAD